MEYDSPLPISRSAVHVAAPEKFVRSAHDPDIPRRRATVLGYEGRLDPPRDEIAEEVNRLRSKSLPNPDIPSSQIILPLGPRSSFKQEHILSDDEALSLHFDAPHRIELFEIPPAKHPSHIEEPQITAHPMAELDKMRAPPPIRIDHTRLQFTSDPSVKPASTESDGKIEPFVPQFYRFPSNALPVMTFASPHQITSLVQLKTCEDSSSIRNVVLKDRKMSGKEVRELFREISHFSKLENLSLVNLGIRKIPIMGNFAEIRQCDLSSNEISESATLIEFLENCPKMEIFNLNGNPVCLKRNFRGKIIAACPTLQQLNRIPVQLEERVAALLSYRPKEWAGRIWELHWEQILCSQVEVRKMSSWQPHRITTLILRGISLRVFRVGGLFNLKDLDLSNNLISDLLESGIESCVNLKSINLSHNNLISASSLRVFSATTRLGSIDLSDNSYKNKKLSEYRLNLIYITRYHVGDSRSLGISQIDGRKVSYEEKITAVIRASKNSEFRKIVGKYAWDLALVRLHGHGILQENPRKSQLKDLKLPSCHLTHSVDVGNFLGMVQLDFSGNSLVKVKNLGFLENLRFLNLSGNPRLDINRVLEQLERCLFLEQLSLGMWEPGHAHYYKDSKYRKRILARLLPRSIRLKFLDFIWIGAEERLQAAKSFPEIDKSQLEKYRYHLYVTLLHTKREFPDCGINEVVVGRQFDPSAITSLQMTGCALAHVDVSMFDNLLQLDLSHNKLTTCFRLGISQKHLSQIKSVNLSHNQISDPLFDIASLVDSFSQLESLKIRGNFAMKSDQDRIQFLGMLTSVRRPPFKLKIVDSPITIDERISAWNSVGGSTVSDSDSGNLRWDIAMAIKQLDSVKLKQVEILDLSYYNFSKLQVENLFNLKVLLLRGNALTNLSELGIPNLAKLEVLDVRDNSNLKLGDVGNTVIQLENLRSLGISGNRFSSPQKKNWRIKLLSKLFGTSGNFSTFKLKIRLIDDTPITVDEIVSAWKTQRKFGENSRNFRFRALMLMNFPTGTDFSTLVQLDLSNSQLSHVDFSSTPNLLKLNLRGNNFREFSNCNFHLLSKLEGLDVSQNRIVSMESISQVVGKLRNIRFLFVYGNPCFPQDENLLRIDLLAKLYLHFHPLSFPLGFLNSVALTIPEQCSAMKKSRAKISDIDAIRLNLCYRTDMIDEECQTLNLSECGFKMISTPINLPNLTHLILSRNYLRKIPPLSHLKQLMHLDLSFNKLAGISKIQIAIQDCFNLRVLRIQSSTRNSKETEHPAEYLPIIGRNFKRILIIDDLTNPFATFSENQ
eukprot:TRINITY_DN6257_c0_g1_i1.p1 TRINITY_DN6257_c0_g1~~TRINITY_DN6257_c0_g1_i1.p1  ORF type:complete len:1295 (+),score=537.13 TRINITY_DN6257_c0_g1_i1:416-4300(+)